MATKTFEIYETCTGHTMIEAGRDIIELLSDEEIEDHVLIHTFEAKTYVEAMQKRNDFLGFGKYYPMTDKKTGLPYPEHFEEFPDV